MIAAELATFTVKGFINECVPFTHADLLSNIPAGRSRTRARTGFLGCQHQPTPTLSPSKRIFSSKAGLFYQIFWNKAACVNNKHNHGCRRYVSPFIGVYGDTWADPRFDIKQLQQKDSSRKTSKIRFASEASQHPFLEAIETFSGNEIVFFSWKVSSA